jgi:hypothetical protein
MIIVRSTDTVKNVLVEGGGIVIPDHHRVLFRPTAQYGGWVRTAEGDLLQKRQWLLLGLELDQLVMLLVQV